MLLQANPIQEGFPEVVSQSSFLIQTQFSIGEQSGIGGEELCDIGPVY